MPTSKPLALLVLSLLLQGCVPVPIITAEQAPELSPHVPVEFLSPNVESLAIVSTVRQDGPVKRSIVLDRPMEVKGGDFAGLQQSLERTSMTLLLIPGGPLEFRYWLNEVCLIASNGRVASLIKKGKSWQASAVTVVDGEWSHSFARSLTGDSPPAATDVGKPAPCTALDGAFLEIPWNSEDRRRVIDFLRRLPSG